MYFKYCTLHSTVYTVKSWLRCGVEFYDAHRSQEISDITWCMLDAVVTAPTVRILYNSSMSNYSSSGSHPVPVAEDSVTIWDNQDIVKTTWGFDRFVVPAYNAKLLHCRGEFLYRANGLESGRVHLVCCCYVFLYNNLNRRDAWGYQIWYILMTFRQPDVAGTSETKYNDRKMR